jgi:hypothetical protein
MGFIFYIYSLITGYGIRAVHYDLPDVLLLMFVLPYISYGAFIGTMPIIITAFLKRTKNTE